METPVYFLKGKRVGLRKPTKGDAELLLRINDEEVRQFLALFRPLNDADEEKWVAGLSDRPNDYIFAIDALCKPDGSGPEEEFTPVLIGTMGFHSVDHRKQYGTSGSAILNKAYWGNGFGTESKILLLEYAFGKLNLESVRSEVLDSNLRSANALRKAGYEECGRWKKAERKKDGWHDLILFQVMREGWHEMIQPLKKRYGLL